MGIPHFVFVAICVVSCIVVNMAQNPRIVHTATVPYAATQMLNEILYRDGRAPSAYRRETQFHNWEQRLPTTYTRNGRTYDIGYLEYDVYTNVGQERIILGTDGSAYYSPDHYEHFWVMGFYEQTVGVTTLRLLRQRFHLDFGQPHPTPRPCCRHDELKKRSADNNDNWQAMKEKLQHLFGLGEETPMQQRTSSQKPYQPVVDNTHILH